MTDYNIMWYIRKGLFWLQLELDLKRWALSLETVLDFRFKFFRWSVELGPVMLTMGIDNDL